MAGTRSSRGLKRFGLVSGLVAFVMSVGAVTASAQVAVPPQGASKLIDQIRKNGELRGGTAIGAPGLLQDPATGQLVGPAMTIGQAAAKALGVKFTPVQSNWDVIIAGLQSGRYELAIAPLRSTPQRLEVVDLIPYYSEGLCYSMRKDNPKMANITTIDQLDNPDIMFATVAGSSPEGHIRKRFPKAQKKSIQAPPGGDFITEEVIARRADVASLAASQVKVLHARFPDLRTVPSLDECLKSPDDKVPTGMAILKGDPEAVKFFTAVVKSIEPEIQAALQKYTSPEFMIRR